MGFSDLSLQSGIMESMSRLDLRDDVFRLVALILVFGGFHFTGMYTTYLGNIMVTKKINCIGIRLSKLGKLVNSREGLTFYLLHWR